MRACPLAATILAITTLPVLAASGNWNPYLPVTVATLRVMVATLEALLLRSLALALASLF
jgi:hypothetical protein